jgi:hypothetical protein
MLSLRNCLVVNELVIRLGALREIHGRLIPEGREGGNRTGSVARAFG